MTDVAGPLVLYVEDEVLIQEVASVALADAGFAVSSHLSGDEALAALETNGSSVRALVTDINLGAPPHGWEIARRARVLLPDLAVVYVSGGSSHEWSAMGVPGSVMIAKPYAAAQLVVAVSTAMLGGPAPAD